MYNVIFFSTLRNLQFTNKHNILHAYAAYHVHNLRYQGDLDTTASLPMTPIIMLSRAIAHRTGMISDRQFDPRRMSLSHYVCTCIL